MPGFETEKSNVKRGSYTSSLLGDLRAYLASMQGYKVMAHELIQNADDAGADEILFDITDDALVVYNSAVFAHCGQLASDPSKPCAWLDSTQQKTELCDFHRITKVASSGKIRNPENIGRFGIGFVSVYQITDHPQILSSGVRLTLYPEREEYQVVMEEATHGTWFTLPWARDSHSLVRNAIGASSIEAQDPEQLHKDLIECLRNGLLFLKHVRKAELRRNGNCTLVINMDREAASGRIAVSIAPSDSYEQWLELSADGEATVAPLRAKYPRLDTDSRNAAVVLALPLDHGERENIKGLFYAYLPTEQVTGLPLHINADFYPEADRRAISLSGGKHEQKWNEALIRCAADRLAKALPELPEYMSAPRIWEILSAAGTLADQAAKDQIPSCLACFWDSLYKALRSDPAICWTAGEQWARCSRTYLPPPDYSEDQVHALRSIELELVHTCLRPYYNTLLRAKVPQLDLGVLVNRLADAPQLKELASLAVVPNDAIKDLLEPLWRVINDLLVRHPKDEESRAVLKECPIALLDDNRLCTLSEACRLPRGSSRKQIREFLPGLPMLATALDPFEHLLDLATPLGLLALNDYLTSRIEATDDAERVLGPERDRLRRFYSLVREIAEHDQSDQSDRQEEIERLASLPIFRGGAGFVPAAEAFLPGDFQDPIGITNILDTRCLDAAVLEFLRDVLEVQEQTLNTFIREQLPGFFESDPPVEQYRHLLEELARHTALLDSDELLNVLRELPMIPTRDGGWDCPDDVYHYSEELEAVFGEDPAWWLDTARLPDSRAIGILLDSLGVRRKPAATHLVRRMKTLAEYEPIETVRRASKRAFDAICQYFDEWERAAGEDIEAVQTLKASQVFPADNVYDRWYVPYELHTPFGSEAFESQVAVLAFRGSPYLSNRQLEYLGFVTEPSTETVIRHLMYCREHNRPIPDTVYRMLNERAENESERSSIQQLRDTPCIYEPSLDRYLRPNQIFWTDPSLGEYAYRLPARLANYRRLLESLGVKDTPSAADCVAILADINERYGDTGIPLPTNECRVVYACLRIIAAALESSGTEVADSLETLRDMACVINHPGALCYPDEIVIDDSEWHRQAFDSDFDARLTKPDPELETAYRFLGIPRLSSVVTPEVDYRDGERPEPRIAEQLRDRVDLIMRVVSDQPRLSRKAIRSILTGAPVKACTTLRIRFRFRHGDIDLSSPEQPLRALYERADHMIYLADPVGSGIWIDLFRTVFHEAAADGTQDLRHHVFIAKQVMIASTVSDAERELTEAGYPEATSDDLNDEDLASPELGGLGTEQKVETANEMDASSPGIDNPEDVAPDGQEENSTPESETDTKPAETSPPSAGTTGSGQTDTARGQGQGQSDRTGHARENTPSGQVGMETWQERARARKDRLRSYVNPRDGDQSEQFAEDDNAHAYAVEDAARTAACRYERKHGRVPMEMSRTHPGYDIESRDPEGNLVRYIEVKGIDGEWTGYGAGLSRQQFLTAWGEGERYWLYVVEFARVPQNARVHAIQNPAMKVDEFFYDGNWRHVAEPPERGLDNAFRPGVRIRHRGPLGDGTIREVIERGSSKQLVVDFDYGGLRSIPLNLAQLELLEDENGEAYGVDDSTAE